MSGNAKVISLSLNGLGSVGLTFLDILARKHRRYLSEFGLDFRVTSVADSSGAAYSEVGFDPQMIRRLKNDRKRVADWLDCEKSKQIEDLWQNHPPTIFLEASPVDLQTGGVGLPLIKAALSHGIHAVLANKAPLVLDFKGLKKLSTKHGAVLAYSATVCGGLPILNIGKRDLIAADITHLRGIFNATSNYLLDQMKAGHDYDAALAEAQRLGIAETDPSLDIEGWDTANKLVIIANSILGQEVTLEDVDVTGITGLAAEDLINAHHQNQAIKLVAEFEDGQLSVAPRRLPRDSFLAQCTGWEMAVELESDLYGKMYHKLWEREPVPTAASMLRDAVNIMTGHH